MDDKPAQDPNYLRDQLMERLRAIEAQIEHLVSEREALRSDLLVTDRFLSVWRREFKVQGPFRALGSIVSGVSVDIQAPTKKAKNPSRDKVVDAARRIIRERGEPVGRKLLYDSLKERGLEVFGKDPEMVLSTMLWRSQDKVVRLGTLGYWLADEPYGPASYYPETDVLIGVAATEPEGGVIEDPEDDNDDTMGEQR